MATTAYSALPFPLCNLPEPDADVTLVDLRDIALPLLQSAHCTLRALSLVAAARDWGRLADIDPTLEVLTGHVCLCRELIARATLADLRDATIPILRSAYVNLHALSLAVDPDQVTLDDLAPALDFLAGQIEACRDLIDRTTRDV